MVQVVISGTGLFTPKASISNAALVDSFNRYVERTNATYADDIATGKREALQFSSAAFIEKASGIKQRYVMDREGILDIDRMCPAFPKQTPDDRSLQCEMAMAATEQALARANRRPEEIDAIYVACSNMERPYPAMAIELQHALGATGYGMDLNVACASAPFAYQTAANAIKQHAARVVLVVNPEMCTAHLNFRDRDSHFIFGDACTATLLEPRENCLSNNAFEVLSCKLKTDYSNNIRNDMGFLWRTRPQPEQAATDPTKLFSQAGRKVFKEVSIAVTKLMTEHLQACDLTPQQLKRLWLHQANASMNQLIINRLFNGETVDSDRAPMILDQYANTSSAGSVIAFHLHQNEMVKGDLGMLCAFGAGYSIGSVIVKKC